MSRRIALCLLAASAALIANRVSAEPRLTYPGTAIIDVPGKIHAARGALLAYPIWRHDPAWKLCQIGEHDRDAASYCLRYSYHPYGRYGYRPNGTYTAYRSPPVYTVAPSAKIISINLN